MKCIDCGKEITSGNICIPCVLVRHPSKEGRHTLAGPSDVDPMERTMPMSHNPKLCPRCKQMNEERENFA